MPKKVTRYVPTPAPQLEASDRVFLRRELENLQKALIRLQEAVLELQDFTGVP